MKIELTTTYSNLDKERQFGLKFIESEGYEIYINWIWFYLGNKLGCLNVRIFPFAIHEITGKVKTHKFNFCNDAKRQAETIARNIFKYYK